MTAGQCATVASILKAVVGSLGWSLHPSSELATMIREVGWMGSFPAEAMQPEAAVAVNKQRGLEAFVLYEQAKRLAIALGWSATITGFRERAGLLRGRLDRLKTQDGPTQDFLFEVEIAYRLFRHGLPVALDEPDVIATLEDDVKLAVACKRPRSLAGVAQAVRRGSRQIRARGYPGFIAVGMEAILHRSGDPSRPTVLYLVSDADELQVWAEGFFASAATSAVHELTRAAGGLVAGVLLCGVITGWSQHPSANIFRWFWLAIDRPTSEGLVGRVGNLLFGQESRLGLAARPISPSRDADS